MANQATQGTTQSSQGMAQNIGQRGQYPVDDLTFDIITVLYEKSKALEAYDKYLQDAQNHPQAMQLFQELRQIDTQCVEKLQYHLTQRLSHLGQQGQQQ